MKNDKDCPECWGTGFRHGFGAPCRGIRVDLPLTGLGESLRPMTPAPAPVRCAACGGSGGANGYPCQTCNAQGIIMAPSRPRRGIPAGAPLPLYPDMTNIVPTAGGNGGPVVAMRFDPLANLWQYDYRPHGSSVSTVSIGELFIRPSLGDVYFERMANITNAPNSARYLGSGSIGDIFGWSGKSRIERAFWFDGEPLYRASNIARGVGVGVDVFYARARYVMNHP